MFNFYIIYMQKLSIGIIATAVIYQFSFIPASTPFHIKNIHSLYQTSSDIVAENAQPELISEQFIFTEGPAVSKDGSVYFTDQPNNKIWKYDAENKLSLFLNNAGRSNGLYFNKKDNLLACADEKNEVWCINKKGKIKVVISEFEGKKLNGPNDLWISPTGGIYLTDPYYQRPYWTRKSSELDGMKVYYFGKNKKLIIVEDKLQQPNGIIGTPDGKHLFVADIRGNKTYKYDINPNGTLSNRQLFVEQGSDGMTIDQQGNIYLTGNGVTVYNPKGEKIKHIDIPRKWTANVCFGGKNRDYLFVTASQAFYKLKMNVKGAF
ncbi:MAG: SMP-30/gluconolactonase/LRE family protein [Sphingobacteriales bacterium]|nr:SMP-30/gluconolactonase/LRE family protein [Sphingobacteriales bacterium]